MELALFERDPEVRARLRRMVLVRLWAFGKRRPMAERWSTLLKERFKTTAIPHYAVLTPKDEVVGHTGFNGGSMAPLKAELIRLMDDALARPARPPTVR